MEIKFGLMCGVMLFKVRLMLLTTIEYITHLRMWIGHSLDLFNTTIRITECWVFCPLQNLSLYYAMKI